MRIALISCTKSKTRYPAPARVLYSESDLFRKALAHVERYAGQIYVLPPAGAHRCVLRSPLGRAEAR